MTPRSGAGTQTISRSRAIASTTAVATTSGVVESGASSIPAVIFVRTNPGRTITTCTPDPTSRSPRPWKNPSTPAFDDP